MGCSETVARPSHGRLIVSLMKIMKNSYETVATESKEFYASLSIRRLARSPGLLANATGLCFTSHGRCMASCVEFLHFFTLGSPTQTNEVFAVGRAEAEVALMNLKRA